MITGMTMPELPPDLYWKITYQPEYHDTLLVELRRRIRRRWWFDSTYRVNYRYLTKTRLIEPVLNDRAALEKLVYDTAQEVAEEYCLKNDLVPRRLREIEQDLNGALAP